MENEFSTDQKIAQFKEQLAGLLELVEDLSRVDNRFKVVRNSMKKMGRLIDPGGMMKAELDKVAARQQPKTKPKKPSSAILDEKDGEQAVSKTEKVKSNVVSITPVIPNTTILNATPNIEIVTTKAVKAKSNSLKTVSVPESRPSGGSGFSTKKPSPRVAFHGIKKKTM